MVGLGEERSEVERLLGDLREAGVDVVTIGQYLPPSRAQPAGGLVRSAGASSTPGATYALSLGFRTVERPLWSAVPTWPKRCPARRAC